MKGPKTTQTAQQQTTNSFGFMNRPTTEATEAVKNFKFQADPSIGYRYGAQRRQINEGALDPMGSYMTPEMREASRRRANEELGMREGQDRAEENQRMNLAGYGQALDYANLMQSPLVQTGGTSSGTQTSQQSGGFLNSLLGAAGQVGSAALM